MQRISDQHSKATFVNALSSLFERASYYGVRALIVIYVTSEAINLPHEEAFILYGWATTFYIFAQIIGAGLGDLILGNRKAIIIGGFIQLIGVFILCIPSLLGVYLGYILVLLGSGLYRPNMVSNFGKLYLNKKKLLDGAFLVLYQFINLGSFIGVFVIGYVGETKGWNYGFIVAGIFMLISTIIGFFMPNDDSLTQKLELPRKGNRGGVKIVLFIFLIALFGGLYERYNHHFYYLTNLYQENGYPSFTLDLDYSLNSFCTIIIGLIFSGIYTFFYSSQLAKMTIGYIGGAIGFGLLLCITETPSENASIFYLYSVILLSFTEVHIEPIIHSSLTKYCNPRYLAIFISLAFIPTQFIVLALGLFNADYSYILLKYGIAAMILIIILLLQMLASGKVEES